MLTMENIFSEIIENGGSTPCRKVNEIASRFPERVAFRDKRFGIWSEISYQSFWDQAQWVGCALNYFGVDRFDKAAVHSENRPEWIIADIGIQSIRAITVGLYPTNPPSEVKYLLGHSETKILFAEDQEQVDKALEVMDELPNLQKIIYFEDRGVVSYKDEILMSWDDFLAIGKEEYEKNNPAILFDNRISFKSEPNERSEELFLLNEGTKVNVLEKINEWSLIELSNGSKGWVLNSTYQLIK